MLKRKFHFSDIYHKNFNWTKLAEKLMDLGNIATGILIFSQFSSSSPSRQSIFIGAISLLLLYSLAIIFLRKGEKIYE